MSCSNTNNNCYAKSCQRYYNSTAQTLGAGATVYVPMGNAVVDSGISIDTNTNNMVVVKSGLYHIAFDAVVNATTAGSVAISVLMDGTQLPCTIRTTAADGYAALHTETDLELKTCCTIKHTFKFVVQSLDTAVGTISETCIGMLKLA